MGSLVQRVRAAVKLPLEAGDAERLRWINEGRQLQLRHATVEKC